MSAPFSYVAAIRDFHPCFEPSPFLCEVLDRIGWEADHHFADWHAVSLERLAEGVDTMIRAVTERGPEFSAAWEAQSTEEKDMQLLGIEGAIAGGLYRYFVCRRLPGATLADALMIHALGSAAQANALAHCVDRHGAPSHTDYEEIAGFAVTAQTLLGNAKLSRQGALYAEQKASDQGRWAAQGRYSRSQEIKNQFVEFYRSGEFRGKADAARRFYRQLSEDDQTKLVRTGGVEGAVRTLRATLKLNGL